MSRKKGRLIPQNFVINRFYCIDWLYWVSASSLDPNNYLMIDNGFKAPRSRHNQSLQYTFKVKSISWDHATLLQDVLTDLISVKGWGYDFHEVIMTYKVHSSPDIVCYDDVIHSAPSWNAEEEDVVNRRLGVHCSSLLHHTIQSVMSCNLISHRYELWNNEILCSKIRFQYHSHGPRVLFIL
jgi:hypothetical protein